MGGGGEQVREKGDKGRKKRSERVSERRVGVSERPTRWE